jgi:hypothetical protein
VDLLLRKDRDVRPIDVKARAVPFFLCRRLVLHCLELEDLRRALLKFHPHCREGEIAPRVVDLSIGLNDLGREAGKYRGLRLALRVHRGVGPAQVVADERDVRPVGERVAERLLPLALGEKEVGARIRVGVEHTF